MMSAAGQALIFRIGISKQLPHRLGGNGQCALRLRHRARLQHVLIAKTTLYKGVILRRFYTLKAGMREHLPRGRNLSPRVIVW